MILASRGIVPPKEWEYREEERFLIRDVNQNTVALLLAKNGIIPPK